MALQAADLEVVIGAETSDAQQGIQGIDQNVSNLAGTMDKSVRMQAMGILADFGNQARGVAEEFISSAMEAQDVQSQLNAVLTSTKGIAGVTAEQANALADSLSRVTKFDDETILSAESLMLTFTQVGKDAFPQAIEAAMNMSQAMGQDLQSSVVQLGKALNDPIQGATALRRVGVMLTDEQEELIKKMVESGDVMGAQNVILKELQTEFGGAARAAGETLGGQLAIAQTQLGNVKEEIAGAFIPVLTNLLSALQPIIPYIQKFAEWFANLPAPVLAGIAAIGGLITVVIPLAATIGSVITAISAIGPLFTALGPILAGAGGTIMAVISGPLLPILAVIAALVALFFAWKNNWLGIRDFGEKIWKSIEDGFGKFTDFISDLWEKVLGGFDEYFANIWDSIVEFASGIWDKFKTGLIAFTDGIKTVWESAWNGISEFFTNIWNKIKETFEGMKTKFIESFSGFKTSLSTIWENTWDLIKSIIGNSVENIKGKAQNIIDGIKGVFDINWRELGENIIDGIVNGLRSGIDWVIEAAQNVAEAALNAIESILGISSPSAEFEKIAHMSIAGLVRGLEDIKPVKIAAQNAGTTMLSAVQPMTFAHAGYSGGNVYNINVSSPGILDERDIANRIREAVRLIERGG